MLSLTTSTTNMSSLSAATATSSVKLHFLHIPSSQPHNLITTSSSSSSSSSSSLLLQSTTTTRKRRRRSKYCEAQSQSQSIESKEDVFQGVYGPWTIESSDVQEVVLYRSGLVTAAASFVLASSTAFLPGGLQLSDVIKANLDVFYAIGACGLGLSLYLIHIYVTEIKRTLQALWALGCLGSLATYLALAQPAGRHLVEYVIQNPTAVWFVGPLFAALTGLVFKEGLCYGKLEAGLLAFIIPLVLLGHLSGLMDDGLKVTLLGSWMTLFTVFAGRKFTQPIKDDIGDKSVFMFYALPEEEKKALIKKLEEQKYNESLN